MIFRKIVFAFLLFPFWQIISQKNTDSFSYLTLQINTLLKNSDFNGVVLLKKKDTTLYFQSMGYANLKTKKPLKRNDHFVIGSISKQITAVLVLQAYEKGELKLTDTLHKYLPAISQPWAKQVTIHQLLTHTHGIIAIDKPLAFEPGSQFQYSQLGYHLLASILEKVSGKSFEILSTELFKQMDLNNTFYPNSKNQKKRVKGYEENENGLLKFTKNSLENYVAAGSFISTAEDLAKWNQLLHSGKLVNQKTFILMQTKFATRLHPIFNSIDYGYGLLFKNGEQNLQIGAFGYSPGFVSASYFYPKTSLNLIVLENTARHLNDFKTTFKVHTQIMELVKNQNSKKNSLLKK